MTIEHAHWQQIGKDERLRLRLLLGEANNLVEGLIQRFAFYKGINPDEAERSMASYRRALCRVVRREKLYYGQ